MAKLKVKEQIVDGRFKAEAFELLAHDEHEGRDHGEGGRIKIY